MNNMNLRLSLLVSSALVALAPAGCDSGPTVQTAAEKKAFLGGPMPKGFMEKQQAGMAKARDAAAKAAASAQGQGQGQG